jgi:hypothetical protein
MLKEVGLNNLIIYYISLFFFVSNSSLQELETKVDRMEERLDAMATTLNLIKNKLNSKV